MKTEHKYRGYNIAVEASQKDARWAAEYAIWSTIDTVALRDMGEVRGYDSQAEAEAEAFKRAKQRIDDYSK